MKFDASIFAHPTAVLHGNITIGNNSSIWANAVIRADQADFHIIIRRTKVF